MEKLSYGGIDVSKDRLDVVVLPEGWFFSVSNDTAGWVELVARLPRSQSPQLASSRAAVTSVASSVPCSRPDCRCDVSTRTSFVSSPAPRRPGQERSPRCTTDRGVCAIMPTRVVQRDDAVERLAEIVTMRRQLCDEHVAVENQAGHLEMSCSGGSANAPDPTGGRYPPPRQAPGRDGRHQCCFRSAL